MSGPCAPVHRPTCSSVRADAVFLSQVSALRSSSPNFGFGSRSVSLFPARLVRDGFSFSCSVPVDLGVIQDSCASEVSLTVAEGVPGARVFFDLVVRLLLPLLVSASALWCSK
jgi:hypothetical protein